jgi:hypothetical protein
MLVCYQVSSCVRCQPDKHSGIQLSSCLACIVGTKRTLAGWVLYRLRNATLSQPSACPVLPEQPAQLNYCSPGLCPSSGILNTRKHSVLETGSVSILR